MQPSIDQLRVRIFADGADLAGMVAMAAKPFVKGFTTNPSLMRKAGVNDYRAFARDVLAAIPDRPVSFEVFADDPAIMERQAMEIATWGPNVNVKIPVVNSEGVSTAPLVGRLTHAGVKVNVTAIYTIAQVRAVVAAIAPQTPVFLSLFAGRVADTGRDPLPLMREAVIAAQARPAAEVLWASTREVLNIFQADAVGCGIITVPNDIIHKLGGVGTSLDDLTLETVRVFYRDASAAGFDIPLGPSA